MIYGYALKIDRVHKMPNLSLLLVDKHVSSEARSVLYDQPITITVGHLSNPKWQGRSSSEWREIFQRFSGVQFLLDFDYLPECKHAGYDDTDSTEGEVDRYHKLGLQSLAAILRGTWPNPDNVKLDMYGLSVFAMKSVRLSGCQSVARVLSARDWIVTNNMPVYSQSLVLAAPLDFKRRMLLQEFGTPEVGRRTLDHVR